MIRREDQKILLTQQRHQLPQLLIKTLQLRRVALRISPVAPQGVEIHQVGETQPRKFPPGDGNGLLHPVHGGLGFVGFCQSLAVENVVDFPHGNHRVPRVLQGVQGRPSVGLQGVVVPVGCPDKFPLLLSHIGPGNHPSHLPLILHGQFPGNLAVAIQVLQAHGLLVAANLQHRVRGGIYDQMALLNLFLPQLIQNLRAAGAFVADDFPAAPAGQLLNQLRGKSMLRKGLERLRDVKPHHLPVAGHGILSGALLPQGHIFCQRTRLGLKPRGRMQVPQSQLLKIRDGKGHLLGDMS